MAVLKRTRQPKSVGEESDRTLRKRIARAEHLVGSLPTAEQAARRRDRGKSLLTTARVAVKEAREARIELERRTKARHDDSMLQRAAVRGSGSSSAKALRAFAELGGHPELVGARLDASLLSEAEGKELNELVSKRREGETLSQRDVERYEELVGVAAGDREHFAKARQRATEDANIAAAAEAVRVAGLPRRPELAEAGSVTLPRSIFDSLRQPPDRCVTLCDLGALAIVLLSLENESAELFRGAGGDAWLERDGPEPVIVVPATQITDVRLRVHVADVPASSIAESLLNLDRFGWVAISRQEGTIRVGRGERAKATRASRATTKPKPTAR